MTDTMIRPQRRRPGARVRFWRVKLVLLAGGVAPPEEAEALATAIRSYPDLHLEGVEQNPLAGTLAIEVTLPAFDAVHAVERAAHVARECSHAGDRGLTVIVRASGGPGRAPQPR